LADDAALGTLPAFAPTDALASALGETDPELVEYGAFLAAADAALTVMAPAAPERRVVVSAELPPCAIVTDAPGADHPARVTLRSPVTWADVAALHIDEADAVGDVALALGGDAAAADRLAERDLLWYDPSERAALLAEL
jgi:hypothetical protein